MVHVGDDEVAAGAQHTGELGHHRVQRGQVRQGQGADDHVNRGDRERQLGQVARLEACIRYPAAGQRQHDRRAVDTNDLVSPSETLGESSGATGSIQGHTGGQPVDDAIDERLIHVEQPVRLVIARRPLLITVDRCPAGGGDSRVRTEHGVVEKLSHLAEPAPGKRLVKVPGPPPQQPGLPAQGGRRAGVGRYSSVQARRKVGAATKGYSERRRLPRGSTPADTALPSGSRVITVQPDFEIDPSGKASPCGFALCRPQGPTPDH